MFKYFKREHHPVVAVSRPSEGIELRTENMTWLFNTYGDDGETTSYFLDKKDNTFWSAWKLSESYGPYPEKEDTVRDLHWRLFGTTLAERLVERGVDPSFLKARDAK